MTTELYNIKNNIEIGKQIFENIPNDIRPLWAGHILTYFDKYIEDIPLSIKDLFPIAENKEIWKDAHIQFTKIRKFGLENPKYKPETYLRLAELVAKVTYNASGEPAPFDIDSGHYIASMALKTTEYFDDNSLQEEVKSALLLFSRNNLLKNSITTAIDFLIFHRIDNLLWSDWDPLGLNDIAPSDEYHSYVPEIFRLVKSKASRQEIADRLSKFETENMGIIGSAENCLQIADKILRIQQEKGMR